MKKLERKGWKKLGLKRVESVADHSFALALIALLEAERRKYDPGVVMKLALIHDLEEAITGDLTPADRKAQGESRVRHERDVAIRKLLKIMPAKSRPSYKRLWMDLRLLRTKEARLVHQLDKFEMVLQAATYSKTVGRQKVTDFYDSATREINDGLLWKELKSVIGELG